MSKRNANTAVLVALTLLTACLFKLSAFAREAFIAAKFGLSPATDAYFALQQLPLTLASFMFGSFALAFTPWYAEAHRRQGQVQWLPGITLYAVAAGAILTFAIELAAPVLLRLFVAAPSGASASTLGILSLCFAPIVCTGIWAGICIARGHNLWAMSMTGLPYLVMTLVLFALYGMHLLNELSLAISMAAGFGVVGACSFLCILYAAQGSTVRFRSLLATWRVPELRGFLRQLAASSLENAGFASNQLLMVYFLARAGTGVVSANTCAMRIGMLGYGLLAQPLAQFVQARLCTTPPSERRDLFRRWLVLVGTGALLLACSLRIFGDALIRVVYRHGRFGSAELHQVTAILPAWIAYFVVMSLNAVAARYLFITFDGAVYVRRMLCAYLAANLLRFAAGGKLSAVFIIWCSVAAEACALALSLRTCFAGEKRPATLQALAQPG